MLLRKDALELCSKFTGKHSCRSVIFVYWSHTSAWVFSCKFAAYFQNTLLSEHLWVAASEAFHESQFRYCFLTWIFHSQKSNTEINLFHERVLRMVYIDQFSSFQEVPDRDPLLFTIIVSSLLPLKCLKLSIK